MWIIKYYEDSPNATEPLERQRWIEPSKENTVGRKKGLTFDLKHPKVSSDHLRIRVMSGTDSSAPSILAVYMNGRLTEIGDEVIDRRNHSAAERSMDIIKELDKTTRLKLGTKGMNIELHKTYILLKVPEDLDDSRLSKLRDLDINYSSQFLTYTTHLVSSDMSFRGATLTALLRGISIIKPSFIDALDPDALYQDFEANFPKVEDHLPAPSAIIRQERTSIFETVIFVFGNANQAHKLGPRLQFGKAECVTYDFIESSTRKDFLNFIQNLPQGKEIVLVKIEENDGQDFTKSIYDPQHKEYPFLSIMDDVANEVGKYLIKPLDIFNAVKDVNLEILSRKRIPKNSPSPSIEPEPFQKKQKKKGKRRPQIKPLDSLDFFAGGGKHESSQTQTQPSVQIPDTAQQQVSETPTTQDEEGPKPKKQRRSRIESLPNQMLDTNYKPSLDAVEEHIQDKSAEVQVLEIESTNHISNSKVADKIQEQSPEISQDSNQVGNASVKKEDPSNVEIQTSFQTAIKIAKKSAQERVNTQLGILDDDILPEDIAQLKNLAIVEYVDFPRRSQRPASQVDKNSQWAGRKNFKTFIKNTSKNYSQRAKKDPSFLYTRTYVPLKTIDPRKPVARHGQFNIMEDHEEEQRQKKADIEIFDGDRDDGDGVNANQQPSFAFRKELRQPTIVDNDEKRSNLFVMDSDDDEDDGLGMTIRKADVQMIPEYKRDALHEPKVSEKQKNAAEHEISIQVDEESDLEETNNASMRKFQPRQISYYEDDDDDESDDDNDTPKFRFRR